ncbi:MAG: hypothetical protein IJN67_07360 [Oscillospiraceae bacterium]|nr:hypothetical protein [Oscillospiraceae bacterium]
MTAGSVLLWFFGILAALVGLCAIVSFFQRHFESEKFDERQQQVRGKANGLAFGFGYVYFLVLFAAMKLGWKLPLDAASLVILGLLMQAMILHIYAMFHHAQLPLGKKHWTSVLAYGILGCSHLHLFRSNQETLRIAEIAAEQGVNMLGVGIESAREDVYLMLVFSAVFFSLAAMHLIRIVWPEKE